MQGLAPFALPIAPLPNMRKAINAFPALLPSQFSIAQKRPKGLRLLLDPNEGCPLRKLVCVILEAKQDDLAELEPRAWVEGTVVIDDLPMELAPILHFEL